MYKLWQAEPPGDSVPCNENSIDEEQILSKYYKNIMRRLWRTTQDLGPSFNIHLIEKVHSDEKLL